MTIGQIFYAYMVLVGLATGAILVAVPAEHEFFVAPYFWILISIAIFEVGTSFIRRTAASAVLNMPERLIGLGVGIAAMVVIPLVMGAPVRFI
ncbi:MAG: hypothetical protein ABI830_00775 [Pseudolabrys sp.]